MLPVAQRYGIGILVWSPLAQGLLTGRVRKGQQTDLRRTSMFSHMRDERRLGTVEQIIPLADKAGLRMTHLAMAFTIAHPGVTSAIIGPRTMEHLDDLLAGADVTLTDEILDQIDEIVPPGTDAGRLDMAYLPPPSSARTSAAGPAVNAPPPDRIPVPLSHGGRGRSARRAPGSAADHFSGHGTLTFGFPRQLSAGGVAAAGSFP